MKGGMTPMTVALFSLMATSMGAIFSMLALLVQLGSSENLSVIDHAQITCEPIVCGDEIQMGYYDDLEDECVYSNFQFFDCWKNRIFNLQFW